MNLKEGFYLQKRKICVYAICKNEESFVDRWMDAVSEADLVVVADTGSTDRTVEKLRARGALVYEESIHPWRFDEARNRAMDHIPDDVDICVSNDVDEVFVKGWRKTLENAWTDDCTRAKYWFIYSFLADGTPEKRFLMEKIHGRHGFRWVHPVHEVLQYTGEKPDSSVMIDQLVLQHLPDKAKSRGQYLPLLELSAAENPGDDRTAFWLGREYVFYRQYEKAIQTLTKHLEMPSAKWDEERSASARYIARAYQEMDQKETAKQWLYRAIAECSRVREPFVSLARLGYSMHDWSLTFFAVEKGLAITTRSNSYLVEPESWGFFLYDMGAIACYYLGLYEKSKQYAQSACQLSPNHQRLKDNLALIERKLGGGSK